MKIRVRLSLLFVLCSTASLLVCGFLLLRASAKGMIRSAQDNAVSELGMLKTSFSSAASKTLDAGASDSLRRSVLVYVFQSYADDTFRNRLEYTLDDIMKKRHRQHDRLSYSVYSSSPSIQDHLLSCQK